ncbi:Rha family transcriptional regulator [Paraburkholderia aspalathi]|nr:Rha family transcriptional regulator [Paraburkholderia aspalathi]
MSSLEIAGLTGKRHDHLVRDIKKMLAELGETFPKNWGEVPSGNGRPLDVCNLAKRETLIRVSRYSTEIRARIIDMWLELKTAIAAATSPAGIVTDLTQKYARLLVGL